VTTAAALWRAGAHVIVCARSVSKGEEAVAKIRSLATSTSPIQSLPLDLGNAESVKAFAKSFLDLQIPLDLLVLNAGTHGGPQCTNDGIEYTLGITHFGHFALTQLLLPKLLETQRCTTLCPPLPADSICLTSKRPLVALLNYLLLTNSAQRVSSCGGGCITLSLSSKPC
jgi:NAD(P)-dependent dehydrogenase (short-subunit alcohol dehydrogenase family)